MRGFWQHDHRLRTSELCPTTCSHSLTTISVPTIFRKLWVDSGTVIGSELCYRSPPSSTFVKQFSFPIFNTALLYLETVSRGRHWNDSNIAEYTIRFLYVLRWYDRVSFREEAHWFYAGYWRTAQLKRSLQQKSLETFGRGFNSRKRSPMRCNTRFIDTWNCHRAISLLL